MAHVGAPGACDGVRKLDTRNAWHPGCLGNEVSLFPELARDEGDGRGTQSSHVDAVTHGAGRTAPSMTVRGDEPVALRPYCFQ